MKAARLSLDFVVTCYCLTAQISHENVSIALIYYMHSSLCDLHTRHFNPRLTHHCYGYISPRVFSPPRSPSLRVRFFFCSTRKSQPLVLNSPSTTTRPYQRVSPFILFLNELIFSDQTPQIALAISILFCPLPHSSVPRSGPANTWVCSSVPATVI